MNIYFKRKIFFCKQSIFEISFRNLNCARKIHHTEKNKSRKRKKKYKNRSKQHLNIFKMMDRQLSFHGDESGVIATNDDASISKRSASKLGYYRDDYLPNFVKMSEKKAPEINRGYFARVKGIEICIEKFLKVR